MPSRIGLGISDGAPYSMYVCQCGVVPVPNFSTAPLELVQASELYKAESARDVSESIVQTEFVHFLMPSAFTRELKSLLVAHEANVVELMCALSRFRGFESYSPTFASSNVFGWEERERGRVSHVAHRDAPSGASDRVCGIGKRGGPNRVGNSLKSGIITRLTSIIDTGNDLGSVGDRLGNEIWVQQYRVLRNVREHDVGAKYGGTTRRGYKSHRRGDHLVAWPHIERGVGGVQGCRARSACHDSMPAGLRRESIFEARDDRTSRQPVASQHCDNCLNVLLNDLLTPIRQHVTARPG